jgi:hypothetical protein
MRRAFDIDVLARPRGGARLRLVATIEDPDAIRAILAALGLSGQRLDRAPPLVAALDSSHAAPIDACAPSRDLGRRGPFAWGLERSCAPVKRLLAAQNPLDSSVVRAVLGGRANGHPWPRPENGDF